MSSLVAENSRDEIWLKMVIFDVLQILRVFWIPIVAVVFILMLSRWMERQKNARRGFEVKQNAGGKPAIPTKEDDHG